MGDLVSIIVPAYQAARYIGECAESVLAQTYADWEMLLIDDGSEDSTGELCRKLCERDSRIRLLGREHRGVSAARNAGMEAAGGKYLFFLDSDDAIHPSLIESLYRLMEDSGAAVGVTAYRHMKDRIVPEYSDGERELEDIRESIYLKNDEAIWSFIWKTTGETPNGIGGKMIRRDAAGAVKFVETFSNGEDTLFIYQMFAQGGDVVVLQHRWYYYRRHKDSGSMVYSVPALRSRYRVTRYICSQEMEKGRMANAVRYEEFILHLIVQWYVRGRQSQNSEIKEYARTLAESEKKQPVFSNVRWCTRLKIFLVFSCYPLYWLIHIFLYWISV